MLKKFNVFALALLIIGQTILGPMAVSAESVPTTDREEIEVQSEQQNEVIETEVVVEEESETPVEENPDDASEPDESIGATEEPTEVEASVSEEPTEQEPSDEKEVDTSKQPEAPEDEKQESPIQEIEEEELTEEQEEELSEEEEPSIEAIADGEKHGFNLELGSVKDLNGNAYGDGNTLDPKDEFYLGLNWHLENGHSYKSGDKVAFQLPRGIKIQQEIPVSLVDDSGLVVANAVVKTDGTVELTFTDYVETHSNVKGHLEIVSEIDEKNVEIEDGHIILKPIGDEGEIRIPVDLGAREKTIEKQGTPNKGYNADEIEWEVTINKLKNDLRNTSVKDVLPVGTEYKEGSLKVTKLKVDINGNILGDLEEVTITGETVEGGTLTIPFGDIKDAYKIEYVTKVTDDEKKTFKNNATLVDSELEDVSTHATVTIKRGEAIKKSAATGYNPKTGLINWAIEFNYNQKDLTNVTLKDAWNPTGKMDLVVETLKFQEVSIDESGKAQNVGEPIDLPNGATLINGVDQFEVTGISTDKAYKVTYQTKVKDRVLEGFKVTNNAGFGGESSGSGTGVGTYYGSKSAGNVNYDKKTIDWTIEMNHDEYPMEKISVLDTLGAGLTLDKSTVKITVDGKKYDGDFTVSDGNPFELKFPAEFSTDKKIVIKYTTSFVADEVTDNIAKNKAALTWTPGGGSTSITKEVTAQKKLNKRTEDNSWKNGSYNPETKEITWTIFTNYRENQINNLIVKDEPQGNQKIVAGSAVVTELKIASNGNMSDVKQLDKNVSTIDVDSNSLVVSIGETNKAYKIEYKTSIADLSDIQKEYVNKAEVFDGEKSLSKIDAKVGIAKAHTYGAKSGKQEGKQIHWAVTVNPGQQKVINLQLEDTVSSNQDILTDTFKVYEAAVNNKGEATKKGEPISADQYVLTHTEGEPTFTIKWNDTVERAFIVEYSSLFFEKHNGEVSNTYKVTGDNIVDGGKTDGEGSVTIKQLGSGGGSGEAGYLVIDKVDSTHGQEESKLAGAEFDLIDPENNKVLKSGKTDENGQIDFGRLLFAKYELVERVVPDGYVTNNERQTITIDKKYNAESDKTEYTYQVENYIPVFAIELLKTGNGKKALPGAEFTLFDSGNQQIATGQTNADGKILFENIEKAGAYYVKETKAPAGYILNKKKYEVIIGEKQKEPVKITAENKARGAVQLTKTDKDTGVALEGVKFTLQKQDGSGKYHTVETFTTNDKGQIKTSNTLEAGNYQFVEEEALNGYRTNGELIKFTVKVNSSVTQELKITNEKFKGAVKLIKSDAAKGTLLSGAKFKLVDSQGEVVQKELITNNKGEIVVENLLLGKYQLIETEAPAGYELDETPIDVEITKDLQVVEKTVTNNKITSISVEKKWNNAGGETQPVTIKLLPTDKTAELNETNGWKTTFENLQVYDASGKEINYKVEELAVDGYKSTVTGDSAEGFVVTNTELTSVAGTKTWVDNNSADRPESITVNLLANDKATSKSATVTGDLGESVWSYEFKDLEKYDDTGKEIIYTVTEDKVDGYRTSIDKFDIQNLRVGTISVKGEKTWKDENPGDRPTSITVNLSRNVAGEADEGFSVSKTVEPNNKGKWLYEFPGLQEFDENGAAYTYTVIEENAPDNYKSTVDGYNITNVRIGETEVTGTKRWKDDKVTDRPESIKVNLLRNDVVIETKVVDSKDNWKYSFTALEKYDDEGQLYKYAVKEHDVAGYKSNVNSFDITNTRAAKKSIEVTKGWLDNDSEERPDSIIVHLFQDDKLFDTVSVTAKANWVYEFTDLEAYNEDGQPFTYKIKEENLEGYQTDVNGFNITNLRVGETEVTGTKTWLDDDSKDRPSTILVKLLANGNDTGKTAEVNEDSNLEYGFTKLPKYDDQGVEITYTVEELAVEGYESTVKETEAGFDITNLRVGKTSVEGTKTWLDDESVDRPETIIVNLLQNGKEVKTQNVDKASEWSYNFTELEKYDEVGKVYTYTIEEVAVEGYESTVTETEAGFDITNLRVGKTSVEGTKTWLDDESVDRPETIIVNLLQNGKEVKTQNVDKASEWSYNFTELEKYDEVGKAYTYTIEEVAVDGYDSTVTETEAGFDITNLRVGKTSVDGVKTWKDDNAVDRPETITINLLQNGVVTDTKEVNEEAEWAYSFEELEKYDEHGKVFEYAVKEHGVPGYKSEVDGFNVTNTKSEKTSVSATKGWKDDNSKARPDAIKVNLLQNGNPFKEAAITAEDEWVYEFKDLEAYDDEGVAYEYTIEEEAVKGYETIIDGFDITNLRVGTTSVEGTKTWKDDNSKDRPEMIKVDLLQNGEVINTVEVTAEADWKYIFSDLAQFDNNGVVYTYTVDEHAVTGYTAVINGYDITNTADPVKPTEPESPSIPVDFDKPGSPSKPGDSSKPETSNTPGKLPQTGEEQFMYMLILGLMLTAVGGGLLIRRGRKA